MDALTASIRWLSLHSISAQGAQRINSPGEAESSSPEVVSSHSLYYINANKLIKLLDILIANCNNIAVFAKVDLDQ